MKYLRPIKYNDDASFLEFIMPIVTTLAAFGVLTVCVFAFIKWHIDMEGLRAFICFSLLYIVPTVIMNIKDK